METEKSEAYERAALSEELTKLTQEFALAQNAGDKDKTKALQERIDEIQEELESGLKKAA
jgi:hypothetical protein